MSKNQTMVWAVHGEYSGEYKEFPTRKDAEKWLKDVKRFDKEQGIKDKWEIFRII